MSLSIGEEKQILYKPTQIIFGKKRRNIAIVLELKNIRLNFVQVFQFWYLVETHRHHKIYNRLMGQTIYGFICVRASAQRPGNISMETRSLFVLPRSYGTK